MLRFSIVLAVSLILGSVGVLCLWLSGTFKAEEEGTPIRNVPLHYFALALLAFAFIVWPIIAVFLR